MHEAVEELADATDWLLIARIDGRLQVRGSSGDVGLSAFLADAQRVVREAHGAPGQLQ